MAIWGISTNTETASNNYAIPKHLKTTDRNHTPHNCFADERGWIYRKYKTVEQSGLSFRYSDEILVPVAGLNTNGSGSNTTGLGLATPVAVFFEDPNLAAPISIGAGGTTSIGAGKTAYVHLVFNELVFVSAGATILINSSADANIVATATSITPGSVVYNYVNNVGWTTFTSYNGQITNRVAFKFTVPGGATIGSKLSINTSAGFVGVITDNSGGAGVTSSFSGDIIRNVGGAGTYLSAQNDGLGIVGLGTTTLTVTA
jgi:hypothetical protein